MNVNGLYKINAKYFVDFPSEHWMENKSGRPHYFCIADTDGISNHMGLIELIVFHIRFLSWIVFYIFKIFPIF